MSYIFEALQRAEAERSGETQPKSAESVAELLREVEQQIATKLPGSEPASGGLPRSLEAQGVEAQGVAAQSFESPIATTTVAPQAIETKAAEAMMPEVVTEVSPRTQPELRPEFPRQRAMAAPASGDLATGAALAAAPLLKVEPLVATEPSAYVLPQAAKSPSAAPQTFADARLLSPSLPADSRLVCLTEQGGLAAEKFRVLGLKLRHLRERRQLKRIVVTGTAPEEGKSLVAANLALNQSRSKVLKTLLIDGDLRRPTVASRFGIDGSLPGLSDCLRGERDLTEVVYKLNGSGLYLIPAGRAPENPLDLMQSGRLPELLDQLGKFFDWIIIDTPPVIPVADTTFWMKLADGVLVVIREGVSEKKVVERALDSFDRAALLGVVVNSCSRSDHKDYYSRYSQSLNRTTTQSDRAIPPATDH